MAKKKEIQEGLKQLKVIVQENQATIGADLVLKKLRSGNLNKVYLAINCPQKVKDDVLHYAHLADVVVVELEMDNEELGVFCKKNFFISVLGTN